MGKKNYKKTVNVFSDPVFREGFTKLANSYGIDPSWAEKVMMKESGGDPSARNKRGTATGLGQIIESTARSEFGIGVDDIANMKPLDQAKLSFRLWDKNKSKINSAGDLYLANFYPRALGKEDDFVLGDTAKNQLKIRNSNSGMDLNNDGRITKNEVGMFFRDPVKPLDPNYVPKIDPAEADKTFSQYPMVKATMAPAVNPASNPSFKGSGATSSSMDTMKMLMQLAKDPSMTRSPEKMASALGVPIAEDGIVNTSLSDDPIKLNDPVALQLPFQFNASSFRNLGTSNMVSYLNPQTNEPTSMNFIRPDDQDIESLPPLVKQYRKQTQEEIEQYREKINAGVKRAIEYQKKYKYTGNKSPYNFGYKGQGGKVGLFKMAGK